MSTVTMVETLSTSNMTPPASLLNKKRPLYHTKPPSPSNSGKFTSISAPLSVFEPGKMKCLCCMNLVGVLTCRNLHSRIGVHFPKTNGFSSVLSYAGYSAEGSSASNAKKQNQDSIIMMEDPASSSLVIACLDGHGLYGDKLSQAFKFGLESRLFSHPHFLSDPKEAICSVLSSVEEELRSNEYHIADFSGTTLSLLLIQGSKLLVANVGDSRAIVGRRRYKHHHHHHHHHHNHHHTSSSGGDGAEHHSNHHRHHHSHRDKVSTSPSVERSQSPRPAAAAGEDCSPSSTPVVTPSGSGKEKFRIGAHLLSTDHKPDRPDEYRRILSKGGRVFSVRYEDGVVGPARVWLPTANIPGLAMSRSLGDTVVHTVGVISTPEFEEIDLNEEEDVMLVVATDGLWDFVGNEEVCKIVSQHADPGSGVKALLEESRKRWVAKEEMVDDTTICVVHLKSFAKMWDMNQQYQAQKSSGEGVGGDADGTMDERSGESTH